MNNILTKILGSSGRCDPISGSSQKIINFQFGSFTGLVPAPPASGIILSFIVNIMANFKDRDELPLDRGVDFQVRKHH